MKRVLLLFAALVAPVLLAAGVARAGTIGSTPIVVDCGAKIVVTPDNAGQTLKLDASDPIVNQMCEKGGIRILNTGAHKLDFTFTLDCNFLTIRGSRAGKGIELRGPNLSVLSCVVENFVQGIVLGGDGADISDSVAAGSSGDGFVVKNPVNPGGENALGVSLGGNGSFGNGGWGYNIRGNIVFLGSSTFHNIADSNGRGGFFIRGVANELSEAEATNNNGPGFFITNPKCCGPDFFDTAQVRFNTGPGIIYVAKDDGSNCVGGVGVDCTGGRFYPAGFDNSPGGIVSFGNGTQCPLNSLPAQPGICPIVLGKQCANAVLDACLF